MVGRTVTVEGRSVVGGGSVVGVVVGVGRFVVGRTVGLVEGCSVVGGGSLVSGRGFRSIAGQLTSFPTLSFA